MARIGISIPDGLLESLDTQRQRNGRGVSRSKFINHALVVYLRVEAERQRQIEAEMAAFWEREETEEELDEWVSQASLAAMAEIYRDEPRWE